jgi:hypothetical protein
MRAMPTTAKINQQTTWIYADGGRSFSMRLVVTKTTTGVFEYIVWEIEDHPFAAYQIKGRSKMAFRGRLAAVADAEAKFFCREKARLIEDAAPDLDVQETGDLLMLNIRGRGRVKR